jgi:hypothetical protein
LAHKHERPAVARHKDAPALQHCSRLFTSTQGLQPRLLATHALNVLLPARNRCGGTGTPGDRAGESRLFVGDRRLDRQELVVLSPEGVCTGRLFAPDRRSDGAGLGSETREALLGCPHATVRVGNSTLRSVQCSESGEGRLSKLKTRLPPAAVVKLALQIGYRTALNRHLLFQRNHRCAPNKAASKVRSRVIRHKECRRRRCREKRNLVDWNRIGGPSDDDHVRLLEHRQAGDGQWLDHGHREWLLVLLVSAERRRHGAHNEQCGEKALDGGHILLEFSSQHF